MNKTYLIPVSKPNLINQDIDEINQCFISSWISSKSPWVDQFEEMFAKKIAQTRYGVAVNSGTSALFLALKSLGIGQNDEVILPALTMIATVNAVSWVGAKPVLVDSTSQDDWNINIDQLEKSITKKTKAIMPVHLYGYHCDMKAINYLAKKYRLLVIEDAAEAMGSVLDNKNAGSHSDVSCFSLYINKVITTGNGGMVCTNDIKLYKLIKKLAFFDFNIKNHFHHSLIGYNLVLSGLQAALGVSQIKRFNSLLKKRRDIYYQYLLGLNSSSHLRFISHKDNEKPNFWLPAIIFNDIKVKKKLIRQLNHQGIETRNFFLPIHLQPAYKSFFNQYQFPVAEYFYRHGLLLPSYHDLKTQEINKIIEIIKQR